MHTSTELRSDSFSIELDGRPATIADVLTDAGANGRLGIVVREPCGAVGASLLLLAAITAFYDAQRARSERFYIYPDYFLFHVGRPQGDHSMLDVLPSHKEVVVPDDPEAILEAINDRAITWLVVPESRAGGAPRVSARRSRAPATGSWRFQLFADRPLSGRATSGSRATRSPSPTRAPCSIQRAWSRRAATADPYAAEVARRTGEVASEARAQLHADRDRLRENGRPVESYRRLTLDRALASLASKAAVDSSGQNR